MHFSSAPAAEAEQTWCEGGSNRVVVVAAAAAAAAERLSSTEGGAPRMKNSMHKFQGTKKFKFKKMNQNFV
jgi:hypothetical protein